MEKSYRLITADNLNVNIRCLQQWVLFPTIWVTIEEGGYP